MTVDDLLPWFQDSLKYEGTIAAGRLDYGGHSSKLVNEYALMVRAIAWWHVRSLGTLGTPAQQAVMVHVVR
jgi:hypothetical protein